MIKKEINNEYFEWMYSMVCPQKHYNKLSYKRLLHFLHNVEFVYILDMDENRAIDGIDFRYRFGYENGYPREYIDQYMKDRPCSVLEMMLALAVRIEEQIMDDTNFGDRTGQWFWNMIVSLGLGNMCDRRFDQEYCEDVIANFLNRRYSPNGAGGLFTIQDPSDDLRNAEIWYQAMWYLNEFLDD